MNIIKNSIIDLTINLKPLENLLNGTNYNVSFNFKKFQFIQLTPFTLNNLQELFPQKNIKGNIVLSNYNDALKEIKNDMSFFSYESGLVDETKDEQLIHNREKIFWGIIEKHLKMPPQIVFQHIPDYESFFGYYVMWNFCYIFLGINEGIIIAGSASD